MLAPSFPLKTKADFFSSKPLVLGPPQSLIIVLQLSSVLSHMHLSFPRTVGVLRFVPKLAIGPRLALRRYQPGLYFSGHQPQKSWEVDNEPHRDQGLLLWKHTWLQVPGLTWDWQVPGLKGEDSQLIRPPGMGLHKDGRQDGSQVLPYESSLSFFPSQTQTLQRP